MTGEIFSTESFFWSCLWQSTIFLMAGLLGSFLLRRHSARAHRVLFLAMIAAVIVPATSTLVNHYELGLFVAEPALIQPPTENRAIHEATDVTSNEAIERSPIPINEDLHSAMTVSGATKFPWRSALLYVWIAASLILAARLLVTFVLGVRLLGQATPLNNDKIEQAIHLAKTKLGIRRDVTIYGSANIHSPVIWCWGRRPVLLVPSTAGQFDHGIDWAGVLCHELAHWKRRDHIAGLLAELMVCFLPWHLLLWWAKSRLISLSEQACDDWVIASGQHSTEYAESLLDLTPGGQMAFVPAVVSSRKGLAGRIQRILKDSCGNPRTGVVWALAVSIVAGCIAVGVAFAQSRPAEPVVAEEELLTASPTGVNDSRSRTKLNKILDAMLYHDKSAMPIAMHVEIKMYDLRKPADSAHRQTYSFEQRLDGRRLDSAMTVYRFEDGKRSRTQENRRVFTGSQYVYRQQTGGSLHVSLEPADEAKRIMAYYHLWGGVLLGHLKGDLKPVAAILKDSPVVTLRGQMEAVGNSLCYVVEGKTDHGAYKIWVDPEHDYRIRRSVVDKGPGDMWFGKPIPKDAPEDRWTTATEHTEISDVKLERIGDHFIPTAETMTSTMVKTDGSKYRDRMVVTRSQIDLNPDFEKLGAFVMDVVPDGTPVSNSDPQSYAFEYEFRDGKVIPIGDGGTLLGRLELAGDFGLDTVLADNKLRFDASIRLMRATENETERHRQRSMRLYPTEDGSFRIENVPAGRHLLNVRLTKLTTKDLPSGRRGLYAIEIGSADHEFSIPEKADVADYETVDLGVLKMAISDIQGQKDNPSAKTDGEKAAGLAEITGLVKDPQGRPVSGTSVTLFQTKLEYVTDAEGKFVAALAPSDEMRYFFAVHKQRKLVASGRLAGGKRHLEINLVPAKMVSGRVVDPNGRPVSGAQVAPLPMTSLYVLTDSKGRFDVGWSPKWHAPDHELCLMARHVELNLAAVADISPEDKTINIKLEPALALHGTIEDTDGRPIVGAVVGLSLIRDWGAGTPVKDVVTNYQGRFELPALPQRQEYGVGAKAEGYWRNGITTGVINRVMQVEEVGSIILKKPILSVSGIVLDGSGKPVEGIPVYWRGDGQPPLDSQTDAQGKFTFEKVCQGPAKISAKNETLFGTVETQGGAKDVRLVVGPRFGPRTAEKIESARQHIISFPEDRSMGKLFARDTGQDSWYEGWQELAEAKGDVSVAAGKEVKLEISGQAAGDLSALDKLGPDDLQMLSFGWKQVQVGSLAPIGNLKGLKALNIQSARFDSEDFKHLTGLTQLEVLRFGDYQLTDESMKYIGQLTSLRSLALWGTGISDEGLKHLQDLTNLTFLALNSCEITDQGLEYLRNMTALEGLQIYQTEITDRGLMNLQRFSQLKHIKLDGNGITDRGLKHLENLTSLENIWIDSNPITDEGLSYFAGMKKLKELYASDTKITDAGLVNLRGMKDFHHLLIDGIGDEGIRHLSELPALEFLQVQDAQITKASIPDFKRMNSLSKVLLSGDRVNNDLLDALRTALPDCNIWDPQRSRDYPMPEWRQRFEAVYRLEDEQVLKRISPPFIPERRDYYLNEHSSQAKNISRSPDRFTFHWTGKLKNWGLAFGRTNLESTLRGVLRLKNYEFEGPRELLDLNLPGDWIVRDEVPVAAKLAALQEVLANELDRKIRFEKRTVEHEVIVATGRFSFHPLAEARKQDTVHLYVDELSMSGGGTVDSVAELLQTIGNRANTYVVDRTESAEETSIFYYLHRSSRPLRQMESSPEKTEKLKVFLANLTKQTELQFELGSQPVEVWFVTEENEEKR